MKKTTVFRIASFCCAILFCVSTFSPSIANGQINLSVDDIELTTRGGSATVIASGDVNVSTINVALALSQISGAADSHIILSSVDALSPENTIWSPEVINIPAPALPAEASVINTVQPESTVAAGSIFEISLDTSNTSPGDIFEFDLNFRGLTEAANGTENLNNQLVFANGRVTIIALPGDFNANGEFDVPDIEELFAAIKSNNQEPVYDLDGSSTVDANDATFWVGQIANTFPGDSNLDGEFNSSDLVQIFAAGEYEDGIETNSTWSEGDWNGDCEFDSGDLVTAFQAGAYEQGPAAVVSVPEPSAMPLLATAFLSFLTWRRRRTNTSVKNC